MNRPSPSTGGNTEVALLRALRREPGAYVSGSELAQQLGVTRAAIWARVRELRQLGYEISASPQLGYRLEHAPDLLLRDDLLARLGPVSVIGRDIRVFQETASTNDVADRLGRDGVAEGVVIFAESQTRGRGRLGRRWISPKGKGLWFSVLLRPALPPQQVTRITVMAATAAARAIERLTGLNPEIKWPNDLLLGGRKVAGILTEMQAELEQVRYVVLGIGIDVNFGETDFPLELRPLATSLRLETGEPVERPALAATLLQELDTDYRRLRQGRFASIAAEWADRCGTLGRHIRLQLGSRILEGRAEALDPSGALIIRTDHGRIETVVGGEILLAH